MCGIVGIAGSKPLRDAERGAAQRMADAIVHRGPDDEGFHYAEEAVIGMRRLAIIDLDGGRQPTYNADKTVAVVCNGEIYNYRALREQLEARGHTFRSHSDIEVIPHLYDEHGPAFVEYLDGMFAVALWDRRERKLLLVRDRLGIKPVYYTIRNGTLAFASEVKALLKVPGISAGIDPAGLRDHLTIGYCVAPRTIFTGIQKLPPATMLTWERGQHRVDNYWQIPRQTRIGIAADDWADQVAAQLKASVESHMVSDVPIGAFLSGGIDSSAVVALMSNLNDQAVNTYSIGYKGDSASTYYNELPYASQVAQQFLTRHHEIEVQPRVAELLPKLIWHLEEPISDSAIVTTFLVSELAAESVKVILSGVGGDELFAGYNRYVGDHYSDIYKRIPTWLRSSVIEPAASRLPSSRQSRWLDMARYARRFVEAGTLPWDQQYKYFIAIQSESMLRSLLNDDLPADTDGFDRILSTETADDPLLRLMRVDWQTQLSEDLLLLTDKMSMAVSIECRVPFLDHHLVELAATIPTDIKRPGTELKAILKQALREHLPDSILHRRKRGFGAPVGSWFKGDLQPLRANLLSRSSIEKRGLLSWNAVDTICSAHDQSRHDYTDLILVLLNLEIWARMFIDGRAAADVGGELGETVTAAVA